MCDDFVLQIFEKVVYLEWVKLVCFQHFVIILHNYFQNVVLFRFYMYYLQSTKMCF